MACRLVLLGRRCPYAELAESVGLSASEAHAAVRRLVVAGLVAPDHWGVNRRALAEFLIHALKYVFPADRGALTRGMPTGASAPPLAAEFVGLEEETPVWAVPEGRVRGVELKPLCRSVPAACLRDAKLYEWMALADALRSGRARERSRAAQLVRGRLEVPDGD